ncbi:IQ calmodulin-binding motif [Musa troglodytarum]|uniref:IQ calmodulin-binding motif n=1 Tax=Musa troglodytarum TaxID=320322 RepID=A0A9E7GB81_9LILI|nr:IQ calmodulin-binding motif [Musa troglodytarum]
MRSDSGFLWNVIGSENVIEDPIMSNYSHVDPYARGPTLSQDQLYSLLVSLQIVFHLLGHIILIMVKLKNVNGHVFWEVEVAAEFLADGTFQRQSPHKSGRVPLSDTCSNRCAWMDSPSLGSFLLKECGENYIVVEAKTTSIAWFSSRGTFREADHAKAHKDDYGRKQSEAGCRQPLQGSSPWINTQKLEISRKYLFLLSENLRCLRQCRKASWMCCWMLEMVILWLNKKSSVKQLTPSPGVG